MKTAAALLGSVFALALAGAAHAADIKIGIGVPLTGFGASYGEDAKRGAELAAEEINAKGGIKGDKIQLIVEDDAGTGKEGIASVQKLVGTDKVPIIISGMMSAAALPSTPIARQAHVVYLSTMSSHPDLTSPGGYIFRMSSTDALNGRIQADYATKELKGKTAAGLFAQSDYGASDAKQVRAQFEKDGGTWLGQDDFKQGSTDYRSQLAKLKELKPDLVFLVATHKEAAQIFRQMVELGFKPPVVTTSMLDDPAIFDLAGDTASNVYLATTQAKKNAESDKLLADYTAAFKAKYNRDPGITANYYYDGVRLAAAAIAAVGPDGAAINKWLHEVKDFPGVSTIYSFNDLGDAVIPATMKKLENKQIVGTGFTEE